MLCALSIVASLSCKPNSAASRGSPLSRDEKTIQVWIQQGDWESADASLTDWLAAEPNSLPATMLISQLRFAQKRPLEAAKILEAAAPQHVNEQPMLIGQAGEFFYQGKDYENAERAWRKAIELRPELIMPHRRLASLLNAQGRRYEASFPLEAIVRGTGATPAELLALLEISRPFADESATRTADELSLFALSQAKIHYAKREFDQARAMGERLLQKYPQSTSIAAFVGRVYADTEAWDAFDKWAEQLPSGIDAQPDYWAALCVWLTYLQRPREAIRAGGEALARDVTDHDTLRRLVSLTDQVGESQTSMNLRAKLTVLEKLLRVATTLNPENAQQSAEYLEQLNRPWEALGWRLISAQMQGEMRSQQADFIRRRNELNAGTKPPHNLIPKQGFDAFSLKLDDFPLPQIGQLKPQADPNTPGSREGVAYQFEDIASKVEIKTRYESGHDPDNPEFYLHQVNGGGVATYDLDLDGRCDVYFMQAGGPPNDAKGSLANQWYRQRPDGVFEEVAREAKIDDRGYGQGVCVGDVNQDGFPDLLVANVGQSRLLMNQGDGTFADHTEFAGFVQSAWTSSIAIGDLNGDHLPELLFVNYIDDPQAFEIRCQHRSQACRPQVFKPAALECFKNMGDGTFMPWDGMGDLRSRPNYGFACIIGNHDQLHGNDVFIANDVRLNEYWVSEPASNTTERFQLKELAESRGCATGTHGEMQASMGIASGDFDRNGRIDFHVTNFYNEPVNLYLQRPSGLFVDEAGSWGLRAKSMPVLGFGTQAGDWNNDGWQDLFVLNGHIYDASYANIPYRMKPQLFAGRAKGFDEVPTDALAPYFATPQLGRSVATLDWNRDGKLDLVASHLDLPCAFLENQTPSGHWLQFETIGTTSERDAIGTMIRVFAKELDFTGWQLGGDGYMCTNEPIVAFGLGEIESVERIEVTWPSGTLQTYTDLSVDRRYKLIENDPKPYVR